MRAKLLVLALAFSALLLTAFIAEGAIPTAEREALIALYNSTNGAGWIYRTNWRNATDTDFNDPGTECTWHGVSCDGPETTGGLWLNSNQLSGSIPAELGNLANLEVLHLSSNQLNGSIPAELGNLANLQHLWLCSNQLNGSIPGDLGNLTNLQYLVLDNNQLSGSIPAELGNLSTLQNLNLYSNNLGGSIPSELGNLANLQNVYLQSNQLSGSIPSELVNLTLLSYTDIGYNALWTLDPTLQAFLAGKDPDWDLTQTIAPAGVGAASAGGTDVDVTWTPITYSGDAGGYRVHYAESSGGPYTEFPTTTLDKTAGSLTVTGLAPVTTYHFVVEAFTAPHVNNQNEVTSEPSEEVSATTLLFLPPGEREALIALYNSTNGAGWLDRTNWRNPSDTDFNDPGTECTWYGVVCYESETTVQNLVLEHNQLSGPIPVGLGNLANLQELNLARNDLSGPIPSELGNLANLGVLSINNNELSGVIPVELGNLANLQFLVLENNRLSGPIPVGLGDLTNLQELNLRSNRLSGSIPAELGNLANLQYLILKNNPLSGSIPVELGNLANLKVLWLDFNQLNGSIPVELGDLANLSTLRLHANELSGMIPVELGNLANLRWLYLGSNQLIGPIPSELGNLSRMLVLDLSSNELSGLIPVELGNLAGLENLNLARNDLSGPIPSELGNLSGLENLALEHNQLSGSIPVELGNLAYLGNLGLGKNQLRGSIPPELGNLRVNLFWLDLSSNQLSGSIPAELGNLTNLLPEHTDIGYNALWTGDPTVQALLASKDPDWFQTQTIAPEDPAASLPTSSSVVLNWIPIFYTDDEGAYAVFVDPPPTGELVFGDDFESGGISWWGVGEPWVMTVDKTDNSILVDGLSPDTTYEFFVRTNTAPHPSNLNQVISDPSVTVSETTEP